MPLVLKKPQMTQMTQMTQTTPGSVAMSRVAPVFLVILALAAAASLRPLDAAQPAAAQNAPPPIIAVFIVDGLRPDAIDPEVTPTLHRLQREGTVYTESHAVFPTVTRVNGASLATGSYPNHHGLVGNTMYVPSVDSAPFSAAEWRNLAKLADAAKDGRLLTRSTLAERLHARGLTYVAVSSGSTGSGFVLNPESRRGVGSFVSGGLGSGSSSLDAGTRVAFPQGLNDTILSRFGAAPAEEGRARLDWTERIVREHVLPTMLAPARGPAVLVDWLTEPDSAQHTYGVGSREAKGGLANSDRHLGLFLEAATALGLADRLHVIVTSDHGFARHSEAVSIGGALIRAGLKQSKTSDDVVIASNSQAVAIHVKGRDAARIARVAGVLLAQPWVDLVFTRSARQAPGSGAKAAEGTKSEHGPRQVLGRVPGTFAIELVRGEHPERGADLLVTLRWSSAANAYGVRGGQIISSDSQAGVLKGEGSGHGGLSPWTVRNVLLAWGPRFRRATTVRVPAAIVDVAPTIAALVGLPAAAGTDGGFDGRVLREAFVDGPDPEETPTWRETWRVVAPGYEGAIEVSGTGAFWYVDKGWRVK
jgi:arylsulfatase A-like enzyme